MKKFKLYFWYFILISFVGWLYELIYYLIFEGKLRNNGTMFGPWTPIYGWGGIIIFFLTRKSKKNPIKVFLISMLLSGIIEYATSFYLEKVYGMKWWDYSNFIFNLNGRICLPGLIAFGVLSLIVMYFVIPLLDKIYNKIGTKNMSIIIYILLSLYVIDFIYSTIFPNIKNASVVNLTILLNML